ncbi:hypothetical protein BOW28_02170 [Solemya velum gill symbiont]|uniref:hypothetical protein n=1 Tax=Solemya velum gill symbiont TaxID=2340 RepID=UPI0009971717|nr:hypothetical protein [Solemya velum gill symbiont]OOZ18360.1 hypothetical protein BOW28_02170 [Solemya velum gill symbiont]OOZ27883.1 hypothetical protein BOW32_02185 [Solemya velum gill symbiont]
MILNLAALRAGFTSTPPLLSYRFDKGDPRRLQALTLEQQKERAKARLQEWNSSVESEQPLREFDEAQQVIANEYGFDDWEQLTSHIGKSEIASKAMQAANPDALDGNERVLHIRCGTDIQNTLAVAGFNGDYLPFYDPYVHGPVPQTDLLDEFIQVRANYISSGIHPDYELVLNDLRQQYSSLELSHNYDAVSLV